MNSGRKIKPWEIDEIVDKKVVNGRIRYLVKWRRFSELNTWESAESFSTPDIIQKFEERRQSTRDLAQDRRSNNIRSSTAGYRNPSSECRASVTTKKKIPAVEIQAPKDLLSNSTPETDKIKKCFVNLMKSELQCCICYDIFQEASVTICGHLFCSSCIKQWKHQSSSCPICRGVLIGEKKVTELNNFIKKANCLLNEKK